MLRRTVLAPALLLAVAAATFARPVDDPTVYKTKTGSKYHVASCSSLRKSKVEIKLSQAKQEGLQPCKRCHPPTAN
jgi:methylphosphotriester-DNA--protein-cysteine methyltransferase